VIHLPLRFGSVPDSSSIPLVLVIISISLQVTAMLPKITHHIPPTEIVDLLTIIAHVNQHTKDVSFFEFSQISIRACYTLGVLHRRIKLLSNFLTVLEAIIGYLERHLQK
jgi:hypothetical protein